MFRMCVDGNVIHFNGCDIGCGFLFFFFFLLFFSLLKTPLFTPERPMMYADVGRPTWPQHLLNAVACVISLVLQLFTVLLGTQRFSSLSYGMWVFTLRK